jgi:hypothetical protein
MATVSLGAHVETTVSVANAKGTRSTMAPLTIAAVTSGLRRDMRPLCASAKLMASVKGEVGLF